MSYVNMSGIKLFSKQAGQFIHNAVTSAYNFRNPRTLPLFKCRTKRFQSSFFFFFTILCQEMGSISIASYSSHKKFLNFSIPIVNNI